MHQFLKSDIKEDIERGHRIEDIAVDTRLHSSTSDSSYFNHSTKEGNRYEERERATSTPLLLESRKNSIYRKILRFVPSMLKRDASSVPLFHCGICLENHALSDAYTIHNCKMNHQYCQSSIKLYVESQLKSGLISYHCPMFGVCDGEFGEYELKVLLSEEDYEKYIRLKEVKTNPDFRECPTCGSSVTGSAESPEILCSTCGALYCYFHSNAHPNMSCPEYHRFNLKETMKSVAFIKRNTRRCPRCKYDTEKDGGCNHMTCASCSEDWCWLCGQAIPVNGGNHYEALGGCPGGQFREGSDFALWTVLPCLRWPFWSHVFRAPFYLMVLIDSIIMMLVSIFSFLIALAMLPVTGPLGCFFACCGMDEASFYIVTTIPCGLGFFVMALLMFFLQVVYLPIPLILSVVVIPFLCCCHAEGESPCSAVGTLFRCLDGDQPSIYWYLPIVAFLTIIDFLGNDD